MENLDTVRDFETLRSLDSFEKFMYLYPAEASKDTAKRRLRMFLDFTEIEGSDLSLSSSWWIANQVYISRRINTCRTGCALIALNYCLL